MPFANQIPFGVPNQLSLSTPQNNEGLGVPWGQAMFNLPRMQQTPGTDVNFGGLMPTGNMRFSVSRTTSSDPVANALADIGNPMGGTTTSFSPAPPQQPLRQKMTNSIGMVNPPQTPSQQLAADPFAPIGIQAPPPFSIGTPNFEAMWQAQQSPVAHSGLRTAMLAQSQPPPTSPFVFM